MEADIAYGADFKDVNSQISVSMSMDRAFKSLKEASATLNGKLLVGNVSDLHVPHEHLQIYIFLNKHFKYMDIS